MFGRERQRTLTTCFEREVGDRTFEKLERLACKAAAIVKAQPPLFFKALRGYYSEARATVGLYLGLPHFAKAGISIGLSVSRLGCRTAMPFGQSWDRIKLSAYTGVIIAINR